MFSKSKVPLYLDCERLCCENSLVCLPSAGKNRRLKQAKEEAQAEIEQYRLQREKEFKTKEAAVSHSEINSDNTLPPIFKQEQNCG